MSIFWKVAIAISLVLTLVAVSGNRSRLSEIQDARLASCKQTYEGIREVFLPFFPPPEKRSARQNADFAKLNRTIHDLKAHCGKQTQIQGG